MRNSISRGAESERWLISVADLASLLSLSVRTLRRMDSAGEIPGRVAVGRRVLFKSDEVRAWIDAGLPSPKEWEAIRKAGRARR